MVELLVGHIHFFPAGGRMAGFAGSFESALVGVRVAVDAGIELDAGILHRFFGTGGEMAFLAGHLGVRAGERIFCLRMVELIGLFPVLDVVAARAIRAELAFVGIRVAGSAVLREAHVRSGQVGILNQCPGCRNHVFRHMAFLAGEPGVLIDEGIAG